MLTIKQLREKVDYMSLGCDWEGAIQYKGKSYRGKRGSIGTHWDALATMLKTVPKEEADRSLNNTHFGYYNPKTKEYKTGNSDVGRMIARGRKPSSLELEVY